MTTKATGKAEREGHLQWVPLGKMRAVLAFQEERFNPARVDHLAADFDLDQLGVPVVSERGGHFYIIDGQHRIAALRAIGFGPEQMVQCWVFTGLSEQEEAERFLKLNDVLQVRAYPKFVASVMSGREVETDIDRIIRAAGLTIGNNQGETTVSCVGTLGRVYRRSGPQVLGRAVRITYDAYGGAGMVSLVLDGLARLCDRYDGALQDQLAVTRLAAVRGGVNGLLGRAEVVRRQTGSTKAACVAAAAVEIINAGKGGKKLPGWWKAAS